MGQLDGKTAVVTGGSRGLGVGIVQRLAAEGARVWAVARDAERLAALERAHPGVQTRAADVARPETAGELLGELKPDILVLNAGAPPHVGPVHEQTWEQFSRAWDVDVRASFEFGKASLAAPLAPGSVVVIVSSGAAISGSPLSGGYAGAKRMQWYLAGYLQQESQRAERGIRFVALAPMQLVGSTQIGRAAAEAYAARQGVEVDEFLAGFRKRYGADLTPEAMGQAVLQLIGDEATAGACYGINGGGLEKLS